jgi:hypothetical protein
MSTTTTKMMMMMMVVVVVVKILMCGCKRRNDLRIKIIGNML